MIIEGLLNLMKGLVLTALAVVLLRLALAPS